MAALGGDRGYTLIELVVVVGLVGMLSVGMLGVFLTSLRGVSRAEIEAEIKSQGDYAITKMERNLRQASEAPVCGDSPPSVTYAVGTVQKNYTYQAGTPSTIQNETGMSLFGTNVNVSTARFICLGGSGGGEGRVEISFSLVANGKMNQTVTQLFKTTVAIRSFR